MPLGCQGARQAGRYLRELLLRTDRYRARWIAESERLRGEINHMAVAKVLAAYVARHPTATRGFGIEGRNIKDTVVYALRGERLSRETLELFIGAFSIKDEDAAHLWKQWEGAERAPAVIGNLELPHDVSGYRTPMHKSPYLNYSLSCSSSSVDFFMV